MSCIICALTDSGVRCTASTLADCADAAPETEASTASCTGSLGIGVEAAPSLIQCGILRISSGPSSTFRRASDPGGITTSSFSRSRNILYPCRRSFPIDRMLQVTDLSLSASSTSMSRFEPVRESSKVVAKKPFPSVHVVSPLSSKPVKAVTSSELVT